MSLVYTTSFTNDLAVSLSYAADDMRLLTATLAEARHVPQAAIAVTKTPPEVDRQGIDYVVRVLHGTRESGALLTETITVDMKRTAAGKARYWRSPSDPNVVIETWSIEPDDTGRGGVPGALFRNTPLPDYWAFVFGDLPGKLYLLPAEKLRQAVRRHRAEWERDYGRCMPKRTIAADRVSTYGSVFIPVPLSVVRAAIAQDG